MKILKNIKNICAGLAVLLAAATTTSCQTGLHYEDVPEEYYSDVSLQGATLATRYLFTDCVYAKNFDKYTTYIAQTSLSTSSREWTNNTGSNYTLKDGTVIAPGETATIGFGTGAMTTRDDSSAPDGKVYVITIYVPGTVTYSTANKGYLFDLTKYTGSDHFELVNPENGMAEQVKTATDLTHMVLAIVPSQNTGDATLVVPQNGAPALGTPGDYTQPRQYLVKNNMRRPAGVPQAQRLYEVEIIKLP